MDKYTLVNLGVRLSHARTTAQKRAVIDSFPELEGKSIEEIRSLLLVNESIVTGKTMKQIERNRELKAMYYPARRVRYE